MQITSDLNTLLYDTSYFEIIVIFAACRDDPRWRDDKYGDGKDKCKDLTLDWCNNKGKYSIEAREACPKSCGLC